MSISRRLRMIVLAATAVVAALAVVTLIGARLIERSYPPEGRFVDVDGGRLHIVELGRPDAARSWLERPSRWPQRRIARTPGGADTPGTDPNG